MKKLLYSVAALALAFFVASCQQENLEPVSGNNTVTYTIQVPGATATKAIGEDVAAVTELFYEVYLTEATAEDQYDAKETWLYDGQATISNGTATINLELVNNQNFRVLFWAQVSGTGIYDTENLKAVKMSTALDANQESYAAFSGSDYIKYGDNLLGRTVTLYRPVSQINIATTAESLTLGEDENGANAQTTISFKETGVTVTGLSTTYNIATGAPATDNTEFTYAAKPVSLSESTIKVNNVDYTYVGMNYVGFAPVTGDNVEVSYTITTNEVGVITNTIDNVPVKPNYRTNIIGNLITSTSDYTITLSNEWGGDEIVEFDPSMGLSYADGVYSASTAKGFQAALDNVQEGETIKLTEDIVVAEPAYGQNALNYNRAVSCTIDLCGNTISADTGNSVLRFNITGSGATSDVTMNLKNGKVVAGPNTWCALMACGVDAGAKAVMNIQSLTVEGSKPGDLSVKAWANSVINAQNVTINTTNGAGGFYALGGEVVLDNCTVNQAGLDTAPYLSVAFAVSNNGKMTVNSGNYVSEPTSAAEGNNQGSSHGSWCGGVMNSGGTLIINGGTFANGNYGDDALATAARGCVFVDTGATLEINGGTFNALSKIIDYQNNLGDASKNPVVSIKGGTFSAEPEAEYIIEGYRANAVDSKFVVEEIPTAATIGSTKYEFLADAVNAVQEGETITIVAGTYEESSIKIPASLKNVTFKGEDGAILKDMAITTPDGNSYSVDGLTFDGITFENSRLLFTGWRTGGTEFKNLTIKNCTFKNLDDNSNSAAVHINMDVAEAVNGFTFTDNVIDGATGGSKSGIYAQVTGEVLISGNTINNVSFRPYVIQVTTDDGVADKFIVTDNIFSGSAAGRAQGLGNNDEGTDAVELVVSNNIFKGITNAQQICYWNFNAETTDVDLSRNYYDIDILTNPSMIYYNSAAGNVDDLVEKTIFPIYTELNADGTINTASAYSPVAVVGGVLYSSVEEAVANANAGDVVKLNTDVTLSETLTLPAGVTFNGNGKQINGTIAAAGDLTLEGHTKVTLFSAGFSGNTITIEEGACLEMTGTGRGTFGYANTFDIKGDITDAKVADKTKIQPSLIIPGGISITGGNGFTLNVKDAYVQIGNTSSKNKAANGTFTLNIENSIVDFTDQLTFSEPTSGMNPTFNLNIKDSKVTTATKFCIAAPNTNVVIDNSIVMPGTNLRNSGSLTLMNGSELKAATIQFGENGGNNGTITVDNSKFTITTGNNMGHAYDGQNIGKIIAKNGAEVSVEYYYKAMTIECDATSTFTGTEVQ